MAGLNFDFADEFASRAHADPSAGGLLGMLQRAMQESSLQQQRASETSQPSAWPGRSSDIQPDGLFGKWLALQAVQRQPVSLSEDLEQPVCAG